MKWLKEGVGRRRPKEKGEPVAVEVADELEDIVFGLTIVLYNKMKIMPRTT